MDGPGTYPCCTASTWQKGGVAAAPWNTGIFLFDWFAFFPRVGLKAGAVSACADTPWPHVLCIVCSFFREQQGQTHCLWAAAWAELLPCCLAGSSSMCSSKVLAFTHWIETHAITPGGSHHLGNPVYMPWEHQQNGAWDSLSARWSCPEDGLL